MSEFVIRGLEPPEYGLLDEFLYQAIFVPPGQTPPDRAIIARPELQVYVRDFGQGVGDCCMAAVVDGRVVGAAWARVMNDYGHLDDETPSLAIALLPEHRGGGIGTALMTALLEKLRRDGWKRVSLSVQRKNAAARLYRRLGFRVAVSRDDEDIMVKDFEA